LQRDMDIPVRRFPKGGMQALDAILGDQKVVADPV
jgi:hypothetical protein